jgi:hypothetical protein
MSMRVLRALALASAALPAVPALAQQSPFLPPEVHRALVNEISGDIAFEHMRWFTHYHRPMGRGEGFEAVARYVEQKAREYGLDEVRRVDLTQDGPSSSPNSTDHPVFNMGIIGVPGVTFTNWPDEFIHSSDDDLWQMDPTQLKRNAVAVAATAHYLATAGDAQLPVLVGVLTVGTATARP